MPLTNLNSLRVFAVAAQHRNFQRAAEALHLTHGAVSQRIKLLEAELGIPLFERLPRGVALTPAGAKLRDGVVEALAILDTTAAEVAPANNHVTLHVGPSFAAKWLMPRLGDFATAYPNISVSTEATENLMTRNLGRGEIAIWPGPAPGENPAHHVHCLTKLHLVAVCSPNLPRPQGDLDIAQLLDLPLLQDSHRRWDQLIEAHRHRLTRGVLNFNRSALALDAAINGHGVAIAPSYMVAQDVKTGRLTQIWHSRQDTGQYLFVSWARDAARQRPVIQTVDWILAEFQAPARLG